MKTVAIHVPDVSMMFPEGQSELDFSDLFPYSDSSSSVTNHSTVSLCSQDLSGFAPLYRAVVALQREAPYTEARIVEDVFKMGRSQFAEGRRVLKALLQLGQ